MLVQWWYCDHVGTELDVGGNPLDVPELFSFSTAMKLGEAQRRLLPEVTVHFFGDIIVLKIQTVFASKTISIQFNGDELATSKFNR